MTFDLAYDASKFIRRLDQYLSGTRHPVQRTLQSLFLPPSTAPTHLWNSVNLGPGNWVVTYEERLPFWKTYTPTWIKQLVWRRLSTNSCRAVIAISDHAQEALLRDLEEAHAHRSRIQKKTHRLYPSQKPLVDDITQKPEPPPWRFLLIGTDFYRKGGAETVRAFSRLLDEDAPVELHLVTQVRQRPGTRTTRTVHRRVTDLINRHDRIVLHGKVPHDHVKGMLREAHVGLLPTYHDTFGYAVLEAQAAGCSVVTTNQRALPEINDEHTGWLIEVPLNEKRAVQTTPPYGTSEISKQIEDGIYRAAVEAIRTPKQTRQKGRAALRRIHQHHDPTDAVDQLRKLYRRL